jgi:peptidyl-dipeptidase Dcp
MAESAVLNALLEPSELPYGLPVFADIKADDFGPAIEQGMAEQRQAIDAIVANPEPPSFANTLVPLELSGVRLGRATRIFEQLTGTDTNDQLDALDAELAPKLAAQQDALFLNAALYERVQAVQDAADAGREQLDPEARYLLRRYLTWFKLAGAALSEAERDRLRQLNERIAGLSAEFKIALQADTNELAVVIDDPAELDGLSQGEISAAATAAAARGLTDKHLIPLVLPTAHPLLASLARAPMRAKLSAAQRARGSRGNDHDTRKLLLEIVELRAQIAELLGFENYAAVKIADSMAGTPEAAMALLKQLAEPAAANARREQAQLEHNAGQPIAAADWPFYAERVRSAEYDVDLAALRPYFEVDRVLKDGVFFAAGKLFGVSFTERPDLHGYHPQVRVFEVKEEDGSPVGLFLLDLYARDSKRGGAWMTSFVESASLTGPETAIVLNTLNVPKPADGEATLLTYDEVATLFHEFGHGIHGLLAKATYPSLAGTQVFTDFVEFPSQFWENWILEPEVLTNYAVHHQTGELIPQEVAERLRAAQTFNEGFKTSEYLGAAVIDMAWHMLAPGEAITDPEAVEAFEQRILAEAGLDNPAVPPRYSSPYFAHPFTFGYCAAYYAYIWAEVLDADTFSWFERSGGLRRENGELYRRNVIGFGGTRDPLAAYVEWQGREAPIEPLLERRGLA